MKRKLSEVVTEDVPRHDEVNGGPSQRLRLDNNSTSPSESSPTQFAISYPDVRQPNAPVKQIPFQKPAQLMTYSHDAKHAQRFDNSAMRYYVDPPMGARLDYGYDRWIRKPDERGRLDGLLQAFLEMRTKGGMLPDNGAVSWRGIMTKILTAPYEERDGWELNIMNVDGVVYLEEHLTEARLQEKYVPMLKDAFLELTVAEITWLRANGNRRTMATLLSRIVPQTRQHVEHQAGEET
ncbi:hypothetical protein NMY22_g5621 [Coprinellus aureogranulatus]|nr:hypothetical protein NMY22_g5621 [Coprinellus aureogranulatus]